VAYWSALFSPREARGKKGENEELNTRGDLKNTEFTTDFFCIGSAI
jgi:hypothetical protein